MKGTVSGTPTPLSGGGDVEQLDARRRKRNIRAIVCTKVCTTVLQQQLAVTVASLRILLLFRCLLGLGINGQCCDFLAHYVGCSWKLELLRHHKNTSRVSYWEGFARTSGIWPCKHSRYFRYDITGIFFCYRVKPVEYIYIIYRTREMRPRSCRIHGTGPRVQGVPALLYKYPNYKK